MTVFLLILVIISYYDIKYLTIPDKYIILFLLYALYIRTCIIDAIVDSLICFLALLLINKLSNLLMNKNSIGFGDHKLVTVIAAAVGCSKAMLIVTIASILGCCFVVACRFLQSTWLRILPFAPFLSIGWCLAMCTKSLKNLLLACAMEI